MRDDQNEKGRLASHETPSYQETHSTHHAADRARATPSVLPNANALEPYERASFELIPLKGKVPRDHGWQEHPYTADDCRDWMAKGGNVGVRLRDTDLILDVDPRNCEPGDDTLQRLFDTFGLRECPVVETGGGGWHLYLTKPAGASVAGRLPGFAGVDVKTVGGQVVAAGSVHPDSHRPYTWDPLYDSDLTRAPTAPPELMAALRKQTQTTGEDSEITAENLGRLLAVLDPTDYRDELRWRELMMACHSATAGDGLDEFTAWSTSDPAYADAEELIRVRWESCGRKAGITAKTLLKAVHVAGQGALVAEVLKGDASDDFDDDLEPLPTGPDLRSAAEKLADEWVWAVTAEQFVRRSDTQKFSEKQWKSVYASAWPEGDILGAVWRGKLPIRKFEKLAYLPEEPEFPDGLGGRYNIWRNSGIEAVPGDVSVFLEHMEYLFPDPNDRGHVLDYLALLIQRPADKVNFALLVHGRQGTGKSWLGALMSRIIGARNVVRPSNDEVTSRWTAWMEGAQLAVIDELMSDGRADVANRLKPIITDPLIRIEDKGCKIYAIENRLNLMCFTNHADALKIEHGDRRWLVVFSPSAPKPERYYAGLFDFLDGAGPSAVKAWLLDRPVCLNGKGVAPRTSGKEEMRIATMDEVEAQIAEMIDETAAPFDFDLVRVEDVVASLPLDIRTRSRNLRSRVTRALKDRGAVPTSRYTKGDRPSYQLWVLRNHAHWEAKGAAQRMDSFLQYTA